MHFPQFRFFKNRNFIFYVTLVDVVWLLFPQAFECKAHWLIFIIHLLQQLKLQSALLNPQKTFLMVFIYYVRATEHITQDSWKNPGDSTHNVLLLSCSKMWGCCSTCVWDGEALAWWQLYKMFPTTSLYCTSFLVCIFLAWFIATRRLLNS